MAGSAFIFGSAIIVDGCLVSIGGAGARHSAWRSKLGADCVGQAVEINEYESTVATFSAQGALAV